MKPFFLILTLTLTTFSSSGQRFENDLSGVYTINFKPEFDNDSKPGKGLYKFYLFHNHDQLIYGKYEFYGKKGEALEETQWFFASPYKNKNFETFYRFRLLKDPEIPLGEGIISREGERATFSIFGLEDAQVDYQKEVDEILDELSAKFSLLLKSYPKSGNGDLVKITEVPKNWGLGFFALMIDSKQFNNPFAKEIDIYYMGQVGSWLKGKTTLAKYQKKTQEIIELCRELLRSYTCGQIYKNGNGSTTTVLTGNHNKSLLWLFPYLEKINVYNHAENQLHFSFKMNHSYVKPDNESKLPASTKLILWCSHYNWMLSADALPGDSPLDLEEYARFEEIENKWIKRRNEYLAKVKTDNYNKENKRIVAEFYAKENVIKEFADKNGYSYKNMEYWVYKAPVFLIGDGNGYNYTMEIKDIFDGNFGNGVVDWPFRNFYTAFVAYYDELYAQHLPKNSRTREFVTTTKRTSYNMYGIELGSTYDKNYTEVKVHPEMYEKYNEYIKEADLGNGVDRFGPISSNRYQNLQHTVIYRFLRDFAPGTPEFEQLFRNLNRYANGQKSIQESGLLLNNKATENHLVKGDGARGFLMDCFEDQGFDEYDFEFCHCVAKRAQDAQNRDWNRFREKYRDNYQAFYFDYVYEKGCGN